MSKALDMIIQLNTDKNISGNEKLENYVKSTVEETLSRFGEHITRIEVHLSDENADKKGENDKRCLIEARLANREPMVVTSYEDNIDQAISSALDTLKSLIDKRLKKD